MPLAEPQSTFQIGMSASISFMSGTDRYFFSLVRALERKGMAVRGVVLGDPRAVGASAGIESFAPYDASRIRRWTGLRTSVRRLLGDAPLVASHNAAHTFPALDIIRDRPLVVHFHGPWSIEARNEGRDRLTVGIRRVQELATYRRASRIIAVSHAFRRVLEADYQIDPAVIRVIPPGVDTTRFHTGISRRDARAALGWPTDRPIVVTAARLVAVKGIETLINAIDLLRTSVSDVLLMIAGTGPLEAELKDQVRQSRLEHWVQFVGYLDEKLPLAYRAADVSIVSSNGLEGFPLTVLESLASGTPVLVTPYGGLPETVADLDRALVLPGSSPEDIAEGLRAALRGDTRLPTDTACAEYAQRFEWSAIAKTVSQIYVEAIGH